MKFLKGSLFVFGATLLGAMFKMNQGGDMPFIAFLSTDFCNIGADRIEIKAFVGELAGK
ncbi:MAG: hypothetical protein KH310_25300 [Enterobacteriaceae bacterium]|nr:hypothetical protein [Enterobacteriaceae bacterium]